MHWTYLLVLAACVLITLPLALGAVLILLAYLLLSAGRMTGQSLTYQAMNVVGAAGFVINGWWHGAIPSAALNVLWLLIGAIASWRIIRKRGSSTSAM